jgi:hypothetical protein
MIPATSTVMTVAMSCAVGLTGASMPLLVTGIMPSPSYRINLTIGRCHK